MGDMVIAKASRHKSAGSLCLYWGHIGRRTGRHRTGRRFDSAHSYFERNIRAIEVLIDQDGSSKGLAAQESWKVFDLGHGYSTYDFSINASTA